uniref:HTH three-helical bundle domain-containing protein n=1 Tax=Aegilops tauschii subsp. strangulata TaxID=200361 RepID=A0A453AUX8_AEGTS
MKWLSRPKAGPATETAIRAAVGDNAVTSKALRWLLKQKRGLRRAGTGGRPDPYVYMVREICATQFALEWECQFQN